VSNGPPQQEAHVWTTVAVLLCSNRRRTQTPTVSGCVCTLTQVRCMLLLFCLQFTYKMADARRSPVTVDAQIRFRTATVTIVAGATRKHTILSHSSASRPGNIRGACRCRRNILAVISSRCSQVIASARHFRCTSFLSRYTCVPICSKRVI
jgi:hypothetical protein